MSCICIITALPAESRAFIDALKLRHVQDHGWRLYANNDCLLLQTGIGKLKAAAAASALLHSRPDICAIVNTGVAGGFYSLGTVLLAHQINDEGTGASWFPHLPPQRVVNSQPTACVSTLDKPRSDYQPHSLYDMEAAGILSAATHYLSTDAIQIVKVVSDNTDTPFESLTPAHATTLMHNAVPTVLSLVDWYRANSNLEPIHGVVDKLTSEIIEHVHHTSSDQHQLRRLLYQHHSLTQTHPDTNALLELGKASLIRHQLQTTVSDTPLHYKTPS